VKSKISKDDTDLEKGQTECQSEACKKLTPQGFRNWLKQVARFSFLYWLSVGFMFLTWKLIDCYCEKHFINNRQNITSNATAPFWTRYSLISFQVKLNNKFTMPLNIWPYIINWRLDGVIQGQLMTIKVEVVTWSNDWLVVVFWIDEFVELGKD